MKEGEERRKSEEIEGERREERERETVPVRQFSVRCRERSCEVMEPETQAGLSNYRSLRTIINNNNDS